MGMSVVSLLITNNGLDPTLEVLLSLTNGERGDVDFVTDEPHFIHESLKNYTLVTLLKFSSLEKI